MAGLVEETRKQFQARLKELKPAVDEYRELEDALARLGNGATTQRPTRARRTGVTAARRGTRSGRGQRAQQLLDLLGKSEGPMRPAEIAKAMNVAPSYVSRLLSKGVSEKAIKKSGKGYAAA